jgi:hypothetical protein
VWLGKAGVSGSGPDLFDQPNDLVVAPNGDIFVMRRKEIEALAERLQATSTSKLSSYGPELLQDLATAASLIRLMAAALPGIEVELEPMRTKPNGKTPAAGTDLPEAASAGSIPITASSRMPVEDSASHGRDTQPLAATPPGGL